MGISGQGPDDGHSFLETRFTISVAAASKLLALPRWPSDTSEAGDQPAIDDYPSAPDTADLPLEPAVGEAD